MPAPTQYFMIHLLNTMHKSLPLPFLWLCSKKSRLCSFIWKFQILNSQKGILGCTSEGPTSQRWAELRYFFHQLSILLQLPRTAEYRLGKPVARYCTQLPSSPKDSVGAWTSRLLSLLLVPKRWAIQLNAILHLGFCLSQGSWIHHLHCTSRFSS